MTLPADAPSKSMSSQPLQRDPAKGKGPTEENIILDTTYRVNIISGTSNLYIIADTYSQPIFEIMVSIYFPSLVHIKDTFLIH